VLSKKNKIQRKTKLEVDCKKLGKKKAFKESTPRFFIRNRIWLGWLCECAIEEDGDFFDASITEGGPKEGCSKMPSPGQWSGVIASVQLSSTALSSDLIGRIASMEHETIPPIESIRHLLLIRREFWSRFDGSGDVVRSKNADGWRNEVAEASNVVAEASFRFG
jgi:hypothetical protein